MVNKINVMYSLYITKDIHFCFYEGKDEVSWALAE